MLKISIIVPLFNKAPHIERALASALAQSQTALEIIIVDDGSTDGSIEIVEKLQASTPELVLFKRNKPGPGGYAARNLGIKKAKGDWIAFLDADDEWLPEHLDGLIKSLAQSTQPDRVVTLFSGYKSIYADGSDMIDRYSTVTGRPKIAEMDFETLLSIWLRNNRCPIWTSATMCRRDALLEAGLFPEDRCTRGGDKDTWIRVAPLGIAVAAPAITALYYRDAVNMVTKKNFTNATPCICPTLRDLADQHSGPEGNMLRKLHNKEIFNYATDTSKHQKLDQSAWKDFYWRLDPMRYAVLKILSTDVGSTIARLAYRLTRR